MRNIKKRYVRILKAEVEDFREDIDLLIRECTSRRGRSEISSYVFLENLALLRHEILDIDNIGKMLDDLDLEHYAGLDELIRGIREWINVRLTHHNLTEAVHGLVMRKLEKVAEYVRSPAE